MPINSGLSRSDRNKCHTLWHLGKYAREPFLHFGTVTGDRYAELRVSAAISSGRFKMFYIGNIGSIMGHTEHFKDRCMQYNIIVWDLYHHLSLQK